MDTCTRYHLQAQPSHPITQVRLKSNLFVMGPSSDLQLDPVLHGYLKKKGVHAQLFAFPLLLSLYACVPPLSQVPSTRNQELEV